MPINQTRFKDNKIADFYNVPQDLIPTFDSYASVIHLTNKEKPWVYKDVYGSALWAKYYYKSVLKNKRIKYTKRPKVKIPLRQRLRNTITKLFYYNKNALYTEIHLLGLCMKFKSNIFNRDLHFNKIPNLCLDGFYDAESWGRWSCGRKSKISLPIPRMDNDLQIDFNLHVFELKKILNQHIDVFVNNKKIASWDFVNKKALPQTKLLIPRKMLNKNGVLNIKFEYLKTISPKKLNLGADNRKLAVGFKSMKIIKVH